MSANKYANLPDIDTAPDVYETEDVIPSSQLNKDDSSDDEPSGPNATRQRGRAGAGDANGTGKEELDSSHLISTEEASKKFKRAERKRRQRILYTYPRSLSRSPSPSSSHAHSRAPSPMSITQTRNTIHRLPLNSRLKLLQAELAALEAEIADPSNPALHSHSDGHENDGYENEDDVDVDQEEDKGAQRDVIVEDPSASGTQGPQGQSRRHRVNRKSKGKNYDGLAVDPGRMIRGLMDVRMRLENVRKEKEGRGKLVGVVLGENSGVQADEDNKSDGEGEGESFEEVEAGGADSKGKVTASTQSEKEMLEIRNIVEMDKRVGELEKLVGSSSTMLDEASPLTPPLLPLLNKLNTQLTILTQPRHVDSISRRLKILLSDLDRVSSATSSQAHRRHHQSSSAAAANGGAANSGANGTTSASSAATVIPLLQRLTPLLPLLPSLLTRLRTLSTLHTSATVFESSIKALEEDVRHTREALDVLEEAVSRVEKSVEDNAGVIKGNVKVLEERVGVIEGRVGTLEGSR